MKLSYNWLKDYIKCDLSAQQIADAMTSIGIEVDSVEETEVIEGGHRRRQVHGTSCLRRIVAVAGIVEKTHPCAQQSAGHQAQAGQKLLHDERLRAYMIAHQKRCAHPDSAARIEELLVRLAQKKAERA